eukprot:TRINITY_DN91835_c0_g1_i1.p1 TRINITY_DN91835_c0_g1~~TRINITY_DN91835_c0_g1_i1.p1  ORF type:complete len:1557 (-),score=292.39 TRINITY_DN91835_c0_g1_i1:19-4689(-)
MPGSRGCTMVCGDASLIRGFRALSLVFVAALVGCRAQEERIIFDGDPSPPPPVLGVDERDLPLWEDSPSKVDEDYMPTGEEEGSLEGEVPAAEDPDTEEITVFGWEVEENDSSMTEDERRLQTDRELYTVVEQFAYQKGRIPPPPKKFIPGSGAIIARIFTVYEVHTKDWHNMKKKLSTRMAEFFQIPSMYVELEQVVPLLVGEKCAVNTLMCRDPQRDRWLLAPGVGGASVDGDLLNADPRQCVAADSSKIGGTIESTQSGVGQAVFDPQWEDDEDLAFMVWNDAFCVSQYNTSLMLYPTPMNNTYVTGFRYDLKRLHLGNLIIADNEEQGVEMTLHIVGVIPTQWAKYYNAKFILNGTIPLPLYQPEVIDINAEFTDFLNLSLRVFGIKQKVGGVKTGLLNYLPICSDPPVEAKGCFRMDHKMYENDAYNEYTFKNIMRWTLNLMTEGLSDTTWPLGDWNSTSGPWSFYEWYGPRMVPEDPGKRYLGPWGQFTFPQKEYSLEQQSFCKTGSNCTEIPVAPSPRYLHSAVLYRTWDFKQHAHKYLCNENPECGDDCLTNLTCLGGVSYFQSNFYFRSAAFNDDDGGTIPPRDLSHVDCPRTCCTNRRLCLRLTDVLGYNVPFNAPMMLIFGGKAYEHVKDPVNGRLVYHNCERISKIDLREEWRSCSEVTVNELWRYDIMRNKWEYIKTDSATSPTTGEPVGWPHARFGHGAAIIEEADEQNDDQKRLFMYVFGGMGNQCTSGVCNDVWRYEIPWAAQAFYPKFPQGEWVRGNLWDRLKDCPYGGRYRHGMVGTSTMEYLYVYGGQTLGGFDYTLLRYRVSTDLWEDMRPYGRVSLTRLMYDYQGTARPTPAPVQLYEEETDVDCEAAWNFRGKFAHCKVCPQCKLVIGRREEGADMPTERGDFGIVVFSDETPGAVDDAISIFGGFRTTWGFYGKTPKECQEGGTTSTTTATEAELVADENGIITLTDPPPTTPVPIGPETTTTLEGGVQVVGSFDTLGNDRNPETSVGLITTTATTTIDQDAQVVTITTTATTTTATMTTGTSTTATDTVTSTETTTIDGFLPGRPDSNEEGEEDVSTTEVTTAPPVVHGGFSMSGNATGNPLQPSEGTSTKNLIREGPKPSCRAKYYFDDLWYYDSTINQWSARSISGTPPPARKGHAMIARLARSNDTQLVLFGGSQQDKSMNDIWVLNVKRTGAERTWTKVDKFFPGLKPPSVSFHSMVYVPELDCAYVFGGLHWKSTDLEETDRLRNIDRRCLKEAQGLPMNEQGKSEVVFLAGIYDKCKSTGFCCVLTENLISAGTDGTDTWISGEPPPEFLSPGDGDTAIKIRTAEGALNLTAISTLCRAVCERNAFFPEFYPIVSEGVWSFNMSSCPNNCNNNGRCDFSQCVCEPPWYGADCSMKKCPGTICYADGSTKEQFCMECSTRGKCVDGVCMCDPGWAYNDCSVPICENNCSSTPLVTRGVCVEDFPVHQCHCFGRYSGYNCSEMLCLNACSGRGTCIEGHCHCERGFHGDDCSIFMIEFEYASEDPIEDNDGGDGEAADGEAGGAAAAA